MLIHGDARHLPLSDGCVQTVVTSPPYYGLRDYKTAPLVWGGKSDCQHAWGKELPAKPGRGNTPGDLSTSALTNPRRQDTVERAEHANGGHLCQSCGAWRGSLGLEPTVDLYVEHLVAIFREIRRVLRDDGTVWLVIGDCYQSGSRGGYGRQRAGVLKNCGRDDRNANDFAEAPNRLPQDGLKDKDLVGIPWMVAFALRADGWYLRSEIVWAKAHEFCSGGVGSIMPESVRDRPTRAHETVFLLSKKSTYFYDAEAVKPSSVYPAGTHAAKGSGTREGNRRGTKQAGHGRRHAGFNERYFHGRKYDNPDNATRVPQDGYAVYSGKRNLRDVWFISPQAFAGSHFATFPEKLVEPCILAGSRSGDLVFDPFSGSGTVGRVAERVGRRWIGVDLNPAYHELAKKRTEQRGMRFVEHDHAPATGDTAV